jgi:hypothetical protein
MGGSLFDFGCGPSIGSRSSSLGSPLSRFRCPPEGMPEPDGSRCFVIPSDIGGHFATFAYARSTRLYARLGPGQDLAFSKYPRR